MYEMSLLTKAEDRTFKGILTTTNCDKKDDCVTKNSIYNAAKILNRRNVPLNYQHSNVAVGEARNFQVMSFDEIRKSYPQDAPQGDGLAIVFDGKVYDDMMTDDMAWDEIEKGIIRGFSLGGVATKKPRPDQKKDLVNLGAFEVSLTRDDTRLNLDAVILKKGEQMTENETPPTEEPQTIQKMETPENGGVPEVFSEMLNLLKSIDSKLGDSPADDPETPVEKMEQCSCQQPETAVQKSEDIGSIVAAALQAELQKLGLTNIQKSATPSVSVQVQKPIDDPAVDKEKLNAFISEHARRGTFPDDEDFDQFFGGNFR